MTTKELRLRGGTAGEHKAFMGANREVTVDTTNKVLVVHDGLTLGGFPTPRADRVPDKTKEIEFIADGTLSKYSVAVEPFLVFIDGVYIPRKNYVIAAGSLTFTTIPKAGAVISLVG